MKLNKLSEEDIHVLELHGFREYEGEYGYNGKNSSDEIVYFVILSMKDCVLKVLDTSKNQIFETLLLNVLAYEKTLNPNGYWRECKITIIEKTLEEKIKALEERVAYLESIQWTRYPVAYPPTFPSLPWYTTNGPQYTWQVKYGNSTCVD